MLSWRSWKHDCATMQSYFMYKYAWVGSFFGCETCQKYTAAAESCLKVLRAMKAEKWTREFCILLLIHLYPVPDWSDSAWEYSCSLHQFFSADWETYSAKSKVSSTCNLCNSMYLQLKPFSCVRGDTDKSYWMMTLQYLHVATQEITSTTGGFTCFKCSEE